MTDKPSIPGLILSGGGSRAAYQVGVLKAVTEILEQPEQSPFRIVSGTSAGAINSCAVAEHSHRFAEGIRRLEQIWVNLTPDQVYHTKLTQLLGNAGRWLWNILRPASQIKKPLALLDNEPLRGLLTKAIRFDDIRENIDKGFLDAACITAYNYNTGDSVSFFQGIPDLVEWQRFRRYGKAEDLTMSHLMGSIAIPMVFPSEPINEIHFGDGSMRFLTPLSPALHLGANKLFVVTVEPLRGEVDHKIKIPTIGDISGHLLDSIFIDSLESDIERMMRVNELLAHIPERDIVREQLTLKPVDTFIISPSVDPMELAGQYFKNLPRGLRFFFKRIGVDDENGESILSYLLFDKSFTSHLIELGYQDAMKQQHNILNFFDYEPSSQED
ncbi:patatin-like phospholipase family protein [Kangiella sp.]|uniref:patatin-like phospholipase family protein n=1 Tax=Kangiella sp. TaxID=1920245 RepID=UPI0019B9388C|nr:patatin-like phospholipase family protein [Kangiella sp.]MBD3652816.1 patatin-like phospholipase family protein [Kangiella sp.]